MARETLQTVFSNGTCRVTFGDRTALTGVLEYSLDVPTPEKTKLETSFGAPIETWQEHLAQVNKQRDQRMAPQRVLHGVRISGENRESASVGCIVGKAHPACTPKNRLSSRTKAVPDLIQTNFDGPLKATYIGAARHFVRLIEDHSNVARTIKGKLEAADRFL